MELNLQPPAATCSVTGQPFVEGDRVTSFLVRDPQTGGIARHDVASAGLEGFSPAGVVACSWSHRFKPRRGGEDSARTMKLTAENLFVTLADPSTEQTPENVRLVRFLALLLERKKILRRRGQKPGGEYDLLEHAKTKQVFEVPAGEMTPEFFVQVQSQLSVLVGEPPAAAAVPAPVAPVSPVS